MATYTRVNWQDTPSTATPTNAANFNVMDAALDAIGKGTLSLTAGSQETGYTGSEGRLLSTDVLRWCTNYKHDMTNVPSSLTFSLFTNSNVTGSVTSSNMNLHGFEAQISVAANDLTYWFGSYVTVGNCLLAVDAEARTFDHHCDGCKHVALDVPFADLDILVDPAARRRGSGRRLGYRLAVALRLRAPDAPAPWVPGHSAITYRCRACGQMECFNTGLAAEAEAEEAVMTNPHSTYRVTYGEQARRVRALIRALGYPLVEDITPTRQQAQLQEVA